MRAIHYRYLAAMLLAGCAGMQRDCASCGAESFGADWVVVQVDLHGHAFRCWELRNTSITNEGHSDGIYWEDSRTRNLVHLAGPYTRVQVVGGQWDAAFAGVGLTRESCASIRGRRE
jgi:hypothetical protein